LTARPRAEYRVSIMNPLRKTRNRGNVALQSLGILALGGLLAVDGENQNALLQIIGAILGFLLAWLTGRKAPVLTDAAKLQAMLEEQHRRTAAVLDKLERSKNA
jgi:uncharacterized membrane protein